MSQSSLVTPEELAARWLITPGTLARWRRNGKGPEFSKTDSGISYKLEDIEAYEKSRTYHSTSDYPPEVRAKKRPEKN
jgi:hypothetical protein